MRDVRSLKSNEVNISNLYGGFVKYCLHLDYISLHSLSFSDVNGTSMMVDLTILVIPVSEEPLVRKY